MTDAARWSIWPYRLLHDGSRLEAGPQRLRQRGSLRLRVQLNEQVSSPRNIVRTVHDFHVADTNDARVVRAALNGLLGLLPGRAYAEEDIHQLRRPWTRVRGAARCAPEQDAASYDHPQCEGAPGAWHISLTAAAARRFHPGRHGRVPTRRVGTEHWRRWSLTVKAKSWPLWA
jgi:hypothetical protein